MKRLRIAMVNILKVVWELSELLVISIADFKKISMTDSIKTAAINAPVTIRNTWTQACKSLASLTLDLFKLGSQCL
jgi:hypothetical protein